MTSNARPCSELASFLSRQRIRKLFVTGTDTDVGKTFITGQLLKRMLESGIDAVAMKPIACGKCGRQDVRGFWNLIGRRVPLNTLNPYFFKLPLAPVAQPSAIRISAPKLRSITTRLLQKHDFVLAEGAGGLLVPLTWTLSIREVAGAMKMPVLIVARAGLGTLNHTLMTVEAARASRLKVLAVVLNDWDGSKRLAADRNQKVLQRILKLPVFVEHHHPEESSGKRIWR